MTFLHDFVQSDPARWIFGFAVAAGVASAGRRSKSLSPGGTMSATAIGGVIVGAGGWWTGLLLVAFFVSSSALSHTRPGATTTVEEIRQVRGSQRDAIQVFANGGIPVLCGVVGSLMSHPEPWQIAAAAAMAGATADTWATEIGRRSSSLPRSIVSWKPLSPGTSGAISALGTTGSVAGALLIATTAAAGSVAGLWIDADALPVLLVVGISGIAGSLLDSVLGATLQGTWWCPTCEAVTESAVHRCGTPTRLRQGISVIDNDLVNAISIGGAGFTGLVLSVLWI